MKKCAFYRGISGPRPKNLNIYREIGYLMKLSFVAAVLVLFSLNVLYARSSKAQDVHSTVVSVKQEQVSLKTAFSQIERQTDFRFAYVDNQLSGYTSLLLPGGKRILADVLKDLFAQTSLEYNVRGNAILVIAKPGKQAVVIKEEKLLPPVSGVVRDDKGDPLEGVSVTIKGTRAGTTTSAGGIFSIDARPGDVLVFSRIGFNSKEVTIGKDTKLDITLTGLENKLNEVVVVGYGTQKKVTVTGAVAQVKGAELEKSPAASLSNSLAGRLPGISTMQTSGEPGYDGAAIRIRGTNTLGNTSALIVVDGVPDIGGGLDKINPADIETMSVLKDASSAIYGVRAANGVILITTKRGKSGKPVLSYNFNYGLAQPTVIPKMANSVEYANMNNETTIYDNIPSAEWSAAWNAFKTTGKYTTLGGNTVNAPFQPSDIQKYKDGSDPWGHPNTDWFKGALKTWQPQYQHYIQLRGGSDNFKFLASGGYNYQDAYYKNSATNYKQYYMRINLDGNINKYLSAGIDLNARREDRNFPTESAGSIFRMLMRGRPTEPEVWPNGLPGPDIENGQNPVVITTNQTGYNKDIRDYFQTNGRVVLKIPGVEGLKLTGIATIDYENQNVKNWRTPWYLYTWDHKTYQADGKTPLLTKQMRSTFTNPQLSQMNAQTMNILTSAFLNYDKVIGPHTIALLAAVTKETNKESDFNGYSTNFISSGLDQFFAGSPPGQTVGGAGYNRARLSYFGRAAYNYKEKYLFEFLWRNDYSYLFPPAHRSGFFPGVMGGWVISDENFFKNSVPFVNYLKLRASWGQLGNDQVYYKGQFKEYQYLSNYSFGGYSINNSAFKTLYETVVPNPNFTWEVANNSNVGLEGQLLNGRINFEFDYFYNKRTNILWQKQGSTPLSSGIVPLLPPVNFGIVENKGYEFTLGYHGNLNDFRYSVSVNGGYAKNKILTFDENKGAPQWQWATGHPFSSNAGGAYLVYEYDGVFKDQNDINQNKVDYSSVYPTIRPGDMKFKDVNHDGKIDANDRVRQDYTNEPTFTGGINISLQYKAFDLTILLQGATGAKQYMSLTESGDIGNYLKYTYDHQWTIDNPSSVDPRIANRDNTPYTSGAGTGFIDELRAGYGSNTYYLRSMNYVRLKNLELGYNMPASLSKHAGMSNLRVYVSALNLFTWDKLHIFDPEAGTGNGQYYPQARVINAGIKVTF
ncbi:MAG: TonB-dependent receptor [Niabella sp.]|nr:TonB-dependent receptor [Niabella sp.]